MAITISSQPSGTIPAYNDMTYIVTSDKTGEANFKYVADIYMNGEVTYRHRLAVPPHPTLGVGVFNPARIAETFVSGNFDLDLTEVSQCADSIGTIALKFGEEYGLSSSGTTVYADIAISNTTPFFNGIFDWEEWVDFDNSLYRSEDSSSRFLTNKPNYSKFFTNEKEYLYAINRTSGDIYYFEVQTSQADNTLIGTYRILNNYQARTAVADRMVRCPVGWNLNDIDSSDITVVAGSLPIMTTSVVNVSVRCITFSGSARMETKYYVQDTSCERFTKYRFHFLNKLGGYDSYSFTKKSTFKSDIERKTFKANLGELTSATVWTNSKSQRAITQYATTIEDTVKVTSDWLSSGDVEWLEELVTSPDVYVERDGAAIPVNIITSSFDRQNGEDKKLFNLTLEFKYSYKRQRQRF